MYKRMAMQLMSELSEDARRKAYYFIRGYAGSGFLEDLSEDTMEKVYYFLRGFAGYGKAENR